MIGWIYFDFIASRHYENYFLKYSLKIFKNMYSNWALRYDLTFVAAV